MHVTQHGLVSSGLPRRGLDVLLVGPSHLCQPFAESLLRHEERNTNPPSKNDVAVEALRSYLEDTNPIPKLPRRVHMIERLENWGTTVDHPRRRMDHVVLVVSQSNVEESQTCIKEAAKYLDDDYALLQRLSIVTILDTNSDYRSASWESFLTTIRSSGGGGGSGGGGKRKRHQHPKQSPPKLFPSPVPVFQYRRISHREIDTDESSLWAEQAAVSHMIWERVKSGIRETPFPSSPLVFTL